MGCNWCEVNLRNVHVMICFSAKLEKLTSRFKLIDVEELDDIHQQIEEVKEHLRAKSKIWNYIVLSNMLEKAPVLQHKTPEEWPSAVTRLTAHFMSCGV